MTTSDLSRTVRKRANLLRAWKHVEKRASLSRDQETQIALARFREHSDREIRKITNRLRDNLFVFEPQRGYPKRRKGKTPRPIVVAPIVNRIVQRSILEVCQTKDAKLRRKLGDLPAVIDCETSVGGLPGRGVQEAICKIVAAINSGAMWYVRSDLINFFTTIPKPMIEDFLRKNVSDQGFIDLFMAALSTDLSNESELRDLLDIFPLGDDGVAQGSALSALCANILLSNFDRQLNGRGVTTIRYLDDFVILAPTKKAADRAWNNALSQLSLLKLQAHDPLLGNGKAARGKISEGFDFLSFRIDEKTVSPTREARMKFISDIKSVIRSAKKDIQNAGASPRRAAPMFIQTLALIDKKVRGWGDAFQATTQRIVFSQLDDQINSQVNEFSVWFCKHTRLLDMKRQRRKLGISLLIDTPKSEPSGIV